MDGWLLVDCLTRRLACWLAVCFDVLRCCWGSAAKPDSPAMSWLPRQLHCLEGQRRSAQQIGGPLLATSSHQTILHMNPVSSLPPARSPATLPPSIPPSLPTLSSSPPNLPITSHLIHLVPLSPTDPPAKQTARPVSLTSNTTQPAKRHAGKQIDLTKHSLSLAAKLSRPLPSSAPATPSHPLHTPPRPPRAHRSPCPHPCPLPAPRPRPFAHSVPPSQPQPSLIPPPALTSLHTLTTRLRRC